MPGLSFLSPWYLLGALAIAVPILLHLFRRRTETVVDFPAVRLIAHSPVEQQSRRTLRELILLALRVTALVLLAGAFARPYLAGSHIAADTPVTVVAIDTSFSLSAPAPFQRARELASEAVRDAPGGHAVALVSFGDEASTVAAPTTDRSALAASIASLQPGPSGTRYAAALATAAEIIGGRPGRIVVVTDMQRVGWSGVASGGVPDDVEVSVLTVQSPLSNLAVTSLERRDDRVVASVHNFGTDARDTPVTFSVEGKTIEQSRVRVPAQSASSVVFERGIPASGAGQATIEDAEGYQADNTRYVVMDPPEASRVAVVVADPSGLRGGLYVERALAVAEGGRAFVATVVDGRTLSGWNARELAAYQAVAFLGTRTLDRGGRELLASYIRDGGRGLIALGPDVDPGTLGDVVGADLPIGPDVESAPNGRATLVVGDTRHPVLRSFSDPAAALGDVSVERYRRWKDEAGHAVLARFSGGAPALVEREIGRGRLMVFSSDLDNQWNRFPLSPAFVPFAVETARYLTEGRRTVQSWTLPSTPAGLARVPGVFALPTPAAGSGATSPSTGRVSINVDVRESNPAAISTDEFMAAVARVPRPTEAATRREARLAEDEQRLWQLGLLVMLVALAGEGLIGRRAG